MLEVNVKIRTIIVTLSLLLVGSNIFWLYRTVDSAVTRSYMEQELYELYGSNTQAIGMLKEALAGKTKQNVQAMAAKFTDLQPFEKDGCLWFGWYGFKFSKSEIFVDIAPTQESQNKPVCEPDL